MIALQLLSDTGARVLHTKYHISYETALLQCLTNVSLDQQVQLPCQERQTTKVFNLLRQARKPYPKGEHRLVCLQATQPNSASTGLESTLMGDRLRLLIRALAVTR